MEQNKYSIDNSENSNQFDKNKDQQETINLLLIVLGLNMGTKFLLGIINPLFFYIGLGFPGNIYRPIFFIISGITFYIALQIKNKTAKKFLFAYLLIELIHNTVQYSFEYLLVQSL